MANVFIHFEPIGSTDSEQNYGTTDIPPYVIPGSIEEGNWKARNPNGHTIMKIQEVTTGTTEAHRAAMERNLNELKIILDAHEEVVNSVDVNGWTPLHEGVRRPLLLEPQRAGILDRTCAAAEIQDHQSAAESEAETAEPSAAPSR